MKTYITTLLISILFLSLQGQTQDVAGLLSTARTDYQSGNLENARFSLQEALNGINQAIGRDMLALMPEKLGALEKDEEQDNVTGVNTGFAGLFVNRHYAGQDQSASVEIVSDSPLIGGIKTLLSMPAFLMKDPNQKRIKVDGQKALLTRNESETSVGYEVQLVFGSTLFTFRTDGFDSENEVMAMLQQIPVREMVSVAE
mgnify:CR=1 FL=1